jgi:hypothetical protein
MKLTIELVPSTCWYTNVRSNVSPERWDEIRKKSYKLANNVCEICGENGRSQGVKHFVECHEIWEYDDVNHIQKLVGLISLCPNCHKVKHPGLAQMKGEHEKVVTQLMNVNHIKRGKADEYIRESFNIWNERSKFEWTIDISYIDNY